MSRKVLQQRGEGSRHTLRDAGPERPARPFLVDHRGRLAQIGLERRTTFADNRLLHTLVPEKILKGDHEREIIGRHWLAILRERPKSSAPFLDGHFERLLVSHAEDQFRRLVVVDERALGVDEEDRRALDQMLETLGRATTGLRTLLFELRPPALERNGLAAALRERFGSTKPKPVTLLPPEGVSPLFEAALEATEEAVHNSLFQATTVTGNGRTAEAIPIDRVREILKKYGMGK